VPVTLSVPTGALVALQLPFPLDNLAVQVVVPAALKLTFPVGVPEEDFTVAAYVCCSRMACRLTTAS
jgi:hypothetical protein